MADADPTPPLASPEPRSTRVRSRPSPGGPSATRRRTRRDLTNIALWTLQGWLAMFYFGAGYAALTQPLPVLTVLLRWPGAVDPLLVRLSGALEIGLALAVLAPLASWRALPILAMALRLMLGSQLIAAAYHANAEQLGPTLTTAALIFITLPVLWLRQRRFANP